MYSQGQVLRGVVPSHHVTCSFPGPLQSSSNSSRPFLGHRFMSRFTRSHAGAASNRSHSTITSFLGFMNEPPKTGHEWNQFSWLFCTFSYSHHHPCRSRMHGNLLGAIVMWRGMLRGGQRRWENPFLWMKTGWTQPRRVLQLSYTY